MIPLTDCIIEGNSLASHIPVIWAIPAKQTPLKKLNLVIWQTCFGGLKERVIPQLQELAKLGFIAVSFDLSEHGERKIGSETHESMIERVSQNRRLYFWPIISQTAEDMYHVIDWSINYFNIDGKIIVGGISMGGDIALVAAAIDTRIHGVCATIATPDWLRPGSIDSQGEPDTSSQLLYERYNPITNLHRYSHMPYIHFDNAAADSYVPAEAAHRFVNQLKQTYYLDTSERLSIVEHPDREHGFHPEIWPSCLKWIEQII